MKAFYGLVAVIVAWTVLAAVMSLQLVLNERNARPMNGFDVSALVLTFIVIMCLCYHEAMRIAIARILSIVGSIACGVSVIALLLGNRSLGELMALFFILSLATVAAVAANANLREEKIDLWLWDVYDP